MYKTIFCAAVFLNTACITIMESKATEEVKKKPKAVSKKEVVPKTNFDNNDDTYPKIYVFGNNLCIESAPNQIYCRMLDCNEYDPECESLKDLYDQDDDQDDELDLDLFEEGKGFKVIQKA